jgi:hypothetical protein
MLRPIYTLAAAGAVTRPGHSICERDGAWGGKAGALHWGTCGWTGAQGVPPQTDESPDPWAQVLRLPDWPLEISTAHLLLW